MKRLNPYQRLLEEIQEFCNSLKWRHKVAMHYYPKDRLSETWSVNDLYERTAAAQQIGYEVILEAKDTGLHVFYRKVVKTPMHWEA